MYFCFQFLEPTNENGSEALNLRKGDEPGNNGECPLELCSSLFRIRATDTHLSNFLQFLPIQGHP